MEPRHSALGLTSPIKKGQCIRWLAAATGLAMLVGLAAHWQRWLPPLVPPPPILSQHTTVEVVVAHHSESLGWLGPVCASLPPRTRVTIYSKGPPPLLQGAVPLPNVGREAHTFLHHIAAR